MSIFDFYQLLIERIIFFRKHLLLFSYLFFFDRKLIRNPNPLLYKACFHRTPNHHDTIFPNFSHLSIRNLKKMAIGNSI
jgi:hypothetical protein